MEQKSIIRLMMQSNYKKVAMSLKFMLQDMVFMVRIRQLKNMNIGL